MERLFALPYIQLWSALCFVYVGDLRPLGRFPNPLQTCYPTFSLPFTVCIHICISWRCFVLLLFIRGIKSCLVVTFLNFHYINKKKVNWGFL